MQSCTWALIELNVYLEKSWLSSNIQVARSILQTLVFLLRLDLLTPTVCWRCSSSPTIFRWQHDFVPLVGGLLVVHPYMVFRLPQDFYPSIEERFGMAFPAMGIGSFWTVSVLSLIPGVLFKSGCGFQHFLVQLGLSHWAGLHPTFRSRRECLLYPVCFNLLQIRSTASGILRPDEADPGCKSICLSHDRVGRPSCLS